MSTRSVGAPSAPESADDQRAAVFEHHALARLALRQRAGGRPRADRLWRLRAQHEP